MLQKKYIYYLMFTMYLFDVIHFFFQNIYVKIEHSVEVNLKIMQ